MHAASIANQWERWQCPCAQCVGYVPGHPPPDVEMEDAANGAAPKRRKRSVYVGLAAANHRRDNMEVGGDA